MWKNLSHPNVLSLIGVPDTLENGVFSMTSEWMVNGNIIDYVRNNAGNHLKLVCQNHIPLSLAEHFSARRCRRRTEVSS